MWAISFPHRCIKFIIIDFDFQKPTHGLRVELHGRAFVYHVWGSGFHHCTKKKKREILKNNFGKLPKFDTIFIREFLYYLAVVDISYHSSF